MGKLIQMKVPENLQVIPQQAEVIRNIPTHKHWKLEILAGNKAMSNALYFTAHDHYKVALDIAKRLFKVHQNDGRVPDDLVPAIVVSYLNICDLWDKQKKTTARKDYLTAAFDYLVAQLQSANIAADLRGQLWCGLDKVFFELVRLGDKEIIAMKKQGLMKLEN